MSKYKPGQIVTLKDGNTRYVCKITKTKWVCSRCYFYSYIGCPFCNGRCYNILGTSVYKLISKYVVEKEKRSNASTKD